jgi:hypothetical protein
MKKFDMFFSTDIETDGPLVGVHSMLSLGSVAFDHEGREIGSFSMNLEALSEATQDPDTMKWWSDRPKAWEDARRDSRNVAEVMGAFELWVKGIANPRNSNPIFLAYPVGFDYAWVRWYLLRFAGNDPFQLDCVDIQSYAFALMGKHFEDVGIKKLPEKYTKESPHRLPHVAVQDARIQGRIFMNIYMESKGIRHIK